jgi:integrase
MVMSLFTLLKVQRTRYYLNGKRVTPRTPGATKVNEESPYYYGFRRDESGKQIRVRLFKDKKSSEAKLNDLNRDLERGESNLADPFKTHKKRPLLSHLEEYLPVMRRKGKSSQDHDRKEQILRGFVAGLRSLSELTTDNIDKYMVHLSWDDATNDPAPNTVRKHLSALSGFIDWLVKKKRMNPMANPLIAVDRPEGGVQKDRRALTADEVQRLLDAARTRPLKDASVNRGGRFAKVKPAEHAAELKPETVARLVEIGRERALMYQTAIFTGLRQNELRSLKVWHLDLNRKPYPTLTLPGRNTKNGRAAKLLIVPALADEIRQWIKDTGKAADDPVFTMPDRHSLIHTYQRDMKAAGIEYQTEQGTADFHALRRTGNVMLGRAGIQAGIRMLFMRHSDIRLTLQTYDDSSFTDLEATVPALEKIGLK